MKNKIQWLYLQEFDPIEIFSNVGRDIQFQREICGENILVNMGSTRYGCFKHSLICVKCNRVGNIARLERHLGNDSDKYHFNLYCRENGRDIMMTQDHIIPRSLGGQNKLRNLQTMCSICNTEKSDALPTIDELANLTDEDLLYAFKRLRSKIAVNKLNMIVRLFKTKPDLFKQDKIFQQLISESKNE